MLKYHHTMSTSHIIKHELHSLLQSFPFQLRKPKSNLINQNLKPHPDRV